MEMLLNLTKVLYTEDNGYGKTIFKLSKPIFYSLLFLLCESPENQAECEAFLVDRLAWWSSTSPRILLLSKLIRTYF